MTKNFNSRMGFASMGALMAILFVSAVAMPKAQAAITSQLDLGSRGANVSQLQQFLATNYSIYPQGIVSGYFGALTAAAVTQFQVNYDLDQVGRVGPQTMAKINNIMASGLGLDTSAAIISNLSVNTSTNGATINWTTSELARGQVFYDTSVPRTDEATGHNQLPYIGGIPASVNNNTDVRSTQSVTLTGLQANTVYYYVVRTIDNSGNVSMTMPYYFRTN